MKTKILFTYLGEWLKRINNSWSPTTTDETAKNTETTYQITHAPTPTKNNITINTAKTDMEAGYCSTY